jgi:hypothetical protein
MAALGELVVSLSANTAKFTEGLNKANYQAQKTFTGMKSSIGMVGSALGTTFVAGVFLNFIKGAIDAADAINDIAKANEVAVSSVLRLSQSLSLNGGQADSAGKLFSTLTNKIDEAATGSEKAQSAFAKVGISLDDLAALDSQALFEKTIQGLARLEDPLKRNALASDLLGKAVRGVDIQGLADDYSSSEGQFGDAEQAFNDIGAALDKLDKFTTNVSTSLATTFAPALSGTVGYVDQLIFGFDQLEQNIRKASNAQKESSLFKPAPTINDKPMAGQFSLGDFAAKPKIREVIDPAEAKAAEAAKRRAEDSAKAAADLRKKLSDEKLRDLQDEINFEIEMVEFKNKKEIELEEEKEEERRQLIAETVDKQKEFNAEVERVKNSVDPLRQYNVEIGKLAEMFEMGRITAEEFSIAAGNAQKELLNFSETGKTEFDDLKNAIDGFAQDGADAMADFIFGTKGNFSDMVNSMLKDLARLALQRSLFDPLVKGLGASFDEGGGGILGWIGGMFGGGRAQGGNVQGGKSYLVGEYGPEVVTMGGNGTVTPNMGGNVSVSVNVDANGGSVESNETFGKQLGNAIKATVQSELLKQKRQGGLLA